MINNKCKRSSKGGRRQKCALKMFHKKRARVIRQFSWGFLKNFHCEWSRRGGAQHQLVSVLYYFADRCSSYFIGYSDITLWAVFVSYHHCNYVSKSSP